MKKLLPISLITVATVWIGSQAGTNVNPAIAAIEPAASVRSAGLAYLAPGLIIPAVLPSGIQDPILLEAWVRLYNQHDPIQLWDGGTVTGQDLARYLLEQDIPVEWDRAHACGNGSCSVLNCRADVCTYDDGEPGVDPIYIFPIAHPFGTEMLELVTTLAHEIFHRTRPFGAVHDTRFEEYWAFSVGAQASKSVWPSFAGYDPLDPYHLDLWVRTNRLDPYFKLAAYPASVTPLVHAASRGVDPFASIPLKAYSQGQAGVE